jgi:hypothetical protein
MSFILTAKLNENNYYEYVNFNIEIIRKKKTKEILLSIDKILFNCNFLKSDVNGIIKYIKIIKNENNMIYKSVILNEEYELKILMATYIYKDNVLSDEFVLSYDVFSFNNKEFLNFLWDSNE